MIKTTKVICRSDYLQYTNGELIAFYRKRIYEVVKQVEEDGFFISIKGERDVIKMFNSQSFKFHFMYMAEFRDKRIDEIFND